MAARQTSRSCYIASGAQLLGRGQVVLAGGGRPGRFGKRQPSVPSTSRSIFDLAQRAAAAVPGRGFNENFTHFFHNLALAGAGALAGAAEQELATMH
jgi:hypothetical protein